MMQVFQAPNGDKFAIIPLEEYEALVALRSLEDRRSRGIHVPPAVLEAIAAGEHAVRALRRWRGLSQRELANAANLSNSYLSRLENGWLVPGNGTRRALAAALGVPESLIAGD